MQINEIERNFNSQNLNSNFQRDRLKNTKENVIISFFAFYASKLIDIVNKIGIYNLSARCGSFDTHIDMVHDILCFMTYVIKCHKMPFYDIL